MDIHCVKKTILVAVTFCNYFAVIAEREKRLKRKYWILPMLLQEENRKREISHE